MLTTSEQAAREAARPEATPPQTLTPAAADRPAIAFASAGKRFRVARERTLKEFLPAAARGGGWAAPFWALRDITCDVQPGETVGIIGHNGSGKSTMLRMIAGVVTPTEGSVSVRGRVSPLIELGAGFHPDLTGRENIYLNAAILGLANAEIRRNIESIIAFSGLEAFIDTPVKRYSSGMYMRLAFAVVVHSNPEILLVDEALAVGDAAFQEQCIARMTELKASGATIVVVSHNLEMVRHFCQRALLLDGGRLVTDASPGEAIAEYGRVSALAEAPPRRGRLA